MTPANDKNCGNIIENGDKDMSHSCFNQDMNTVSESPIGTPHATANDADYVKAKTSRSDYFKSRRTEKDTTGCPCKFTQDPQLNGLKICEICMCSFKKNHLKSLSNNKSPGTDGFTAEFYKFFWPDIGEIIVKALNTNFSKRKMSLEQRRGILSLLPKKDKDLLYLKNWRPISLLNLDYKLATKTIANRIKRVLTFIINSDQTGFIKGRCIGENTRLFLDIIEYCDQEEIPSILTFLDFCLDVHINPYTMK